MITAAVWMGDVDLRTAVTSGAIELDGLPKVVRAFPKWFGLHPLFATVDHPASRPRVATGA